MDWNKLMFTTHVLCTVRRTMFNVGPDVHIENVNLAEEMVLEGTSKWSCKIAITGTLSIIIIVLIITIMPVIFS